MEDMGRVWDDVTERIAVWYFRVIYFLLAVFLLLFLLDRIGIDAVRDLVWWPLVAAFAMAALAALQDVILWRWAGAIGAKARSLSKVVRP